ncbi:hypothetical protein SADUNF_Sadunf06G0172300 [Salix dunnii]|uniref:Uncharacterized protein n=1 Tax=Salix dunnii TaxID=1413687 RepID=A0A835K0P7_9ROSI|nr:hypothetical protein SADUNF_Sadunf06G0172300 [Salix dunnii]
MNFTDTQRMLDVCYDQMNFPSSSEVSKTRASLMFNKQMMEKEKEGWLGFARENGDLNWDACLTLFDRHSLSSKFVSTNSQHQSQRCHFCIHSPAYYLKFPNPTLEN